MMFNLKTRSALAGMTLAVAILTVPQTAQAIQWKYPPRPRSPLTYVSVNNVNLDKAAYARARWGRSARVYLAKKHAYYWRVKYRRNGKWRVRGLDMVDVARWQGENRWGRSAMANWAAYTKRGNVRNPYSWRGAYVLRLAYID